MKYPNDDPKPAGAYVRNVHPCATYSDAGVVTQSEPDYPGGASITVAIGTGSTCYGPARNWAPTTVPPEWLKHARPEFLEALELARANA